MQQEMIVDIIDEEDLDTADEEYVDVINILDSRYKKVYSHCKTEEIRSKLRELNATERHQLVTRKNNDSDSLMFVFVKREIEKLLKDEMDPNLKSRVCDDILRMIFLVGHETAFQYLMENVEFTAEARANAHELMGAFYVSKQSPQESNPQIFQHWKEALKIRRDNEIQRPEQIPFNPVPFGHQREFDTEAELNELAMNLRSILIQAVYITRRILGINDPFTFAVEMNLIQIYYDDRQFVGQFKMNMYHLNRVVTNYGLNSKNAKQIANIVAHMYLDYAKIVGVDHVWIKFDDVVLVVNILLAKMKRPNKYLYLLTKLLDLLFRMPKNECQHLIFKNLTRKIVQNKFCDNKGRSMLHIVASNTLPECLNNIYRHFDYEIPQATFVKFLLECGHDVDALDHSKSSPLYLAISYEYDKDMVNCLLELGAHIDRANVNGIRPCHLLKNVIGFDTFKYVTLKCLAARTIVDCRVPYNGIDFPALATFIEMH